MNLKRNLTTALLLSSGIAIPAFADLETTTVRTTTVPVPGGTEVTTVKTTSTPDYPAFVIPNTGSYFIIDPVTGNVIGNYDPSVGLVDTKVIQPGAVIINKESGRVIAAFDANGRTIELAVAPAYNPFVTAIDTRYAKIEAMIADCTARGVMDAAEAAALRTELGRIQSEELAYKQSSGILTYSEALQVALDLNQLEDRFKPFLPKAGETPLVGARIITSNNQLVVVDEIEYRQAKLAQRIDDEYAAGRLSSDQVSRLKDQLNAVAALRTKYLKDGHLTESGKQKIAVKLDAVNTKMDQDVAIINAKRSKIGIKVN